ncbi:MAG: ubiquinone biosynthesis regulatory protein kinase UbiB [Betaproteobacteria bacterium]|nr:ubiquinone biosynthesis regulatory protein kinase UbiB [Betaproteobacteria bacterium]
MRFLRPFYILFIIVRFRLDEFILHHTGLRPLQSFLNGLLFWRKKEISRGERLRLALETLGPIFVKFGQMLSTRRDLIPLDIANELSKLQDQVPPFAFPEVEQIITRAFNQPISVLFSQFDTTPAASASVAQVHFAHLPDGKPVAVKVLRPGIETVIAHDLHLMDAIAWLVQSISKEARRLKPRELVAEFARHTESELDLTLEAANCSLLGRNFSDKTMLIVPEVHWDWCRKEVMVMQRMHGTPISQRDMLIEKGVDMPRLARDGVEIFFTQVFRDGFFHADMHPGNIQVATEGNDLGKYIALDFGIMGTLSDKDKYYLARNFLAFFNQDYRDVAQAHIDSGWVPADTKREDLENAVRAICEPIFNKPLKDISFARTLLSLFQMARRFGVIIQPQLIMLQKTLLNIEGLGRELDPNLDLWKSAQPFLSRWMSEQVGWRSIIKTVKNELPKIPHLVPQLPRLVHEFLSQQTRNESPQALQAHIDTLIKAQQQQNRWIKRLIFAMISLVAIEIALTIGIHLR